MKLYNITFKLDDTRNILVPNIPETAGDDENKTIKRVCLTDSVEHCMQALAHVNRNIASGVKFIVRETSIREDDKALVKPRFIKENNYVQDALENKEYWYLKPVKFRLYLCEIETFDYEFEIAWSCVSKRQILDILGKYTSINRFKQYKTSKGIYNAFCKWSNEKQLWDMQDAVWDDLVEIPWAQKTGLYNLKFKVLKQIN